MKTEKRIYVCGRFHNFCNNPENTAKANDSMATKKCINHSRSLQIYWDNLDDTIKVKENMKVGKRIDPTKSDISEQNAPEKKHYLPGNPDLGLNRKN